MIRDSKVHQMDNVIYSGVDAGMQSMDADLLRLKKAGRIGAAEALLYAVNPELMAKRLQEA